MIYKDCGWGSVNYAPYFYTGKTYKECVHCGNVSELNKKGDVIYAGGTMHNACWYCGTSFGDQHNKSDISL